MHRAVRSLRRRLWQSTAGCDCSPLAKAGERCTASWVRCNGRLGRIHDDYKRYGLAIGPTPEDGIDPKASKEAVERRQQAMT